MNKPSQWFGQQLAKEPPAPVLQLMSGGRVRLDPTLIPHFAVWLLAAAQQWQRILARPKLPGTDPGANADAGMRAWASHALSATNVMLNGLGDTCSVADINTAKDAWADAVDECGTLSPSVVPLSAFIPQTHHPR